MKNVHSIFENILKEHGFGNGRVLLTKEIQFETAADKILWLEEKWPALKWGYGGVILEETPTTIIYRASNSCD